MPAQHSLYYYYYNYHYYYHGRLVLRMLYATLVIT